MLGEKRLFSVTNKRALAMLSYYIITIKKGNT
jgi:hypothetical protein